MIKQRKVGIIGSGHVGSHCALSLILQGICDEIILVDIDKKKANSQALDCMDTSSFLPHRVKIKSGEIQDLADMDIVVISVGTIDNISKNRLSELEGSLKIIKSFIPKLMEVGFNGYFIVITNPVDIVTYFVQKLSGLPHNHVIGTGTGLDSVRLQRVLSMELDIDAKSIQAYMLGEHGDSQVAAFSSTTINGRNLEEFLKDTKKSINLEEIEDTVAKAGWEIYSGKNSTEFGIGCVCANIIRAIYSDEKKVMVCSAYLQGQYDHKDFYIGVPGIIGKDGVEHILEVNMNEREKNKVRETIKVIKKHIELGYKIVGI